MNTEHFARLFEYEVKCTELVIRSLHESQRSVEQLSLASLAAPLERAVAIFCHIQAARRLWLHRVEPSLTPFPADGVFPIWELKKAEREAREMDGLWKKYIEGLPQRELAAPVAYTSTEGVGYESSLADILTHVVNHSSYHRGQIASLVAATGTKPAVTDYIALTRRAV
jgi:uncharacterized damage-inducible protein DinB